MCSRLDRCTVQPVSDRIGWICCRSWSGFTFSRLDCVGCNSFNKSHIFVCQCDFLPQRCVRLVWTQRLRHGCWSQRWHRKRRAWRSGQWWGKHETHMFQCNWWQKSFLICLTPVRELTYVTPGRWNGPHWIFSGQSGNRHYFKSIQGEQ